jgi:hypothetical protein
MIFALSAEGCSSPDVSVTAFHDLPSNVAGVKYCAVPPATQHGSIEHQAYVDAIAKELTRHGLVSAPVAEAQFLLSISYGIDNGSVHTVSNPIYGQVGNDFGVVSHSTGSYRVYERFLEVRLSENPASSERGALERYRSIVKSNGTGNQLAEIMPYLIRAVFEDFPGRSGATRRIRF